MHSFIGQEKEEEKEKDRGKGKRGSSMRKAIVLACGDPFVKRISTCKRGKGKPRCRLY